MPQPASTRLTGCTLWSICPDRVTDDLECYIATQAGDGYNHTYMGSGQNNSWSLVNFCIFIIYYISLE